MAYIQVEASVRTHKKFLKAGPAASWLWLCGMGYCQDGLTDGFIPFEALNYLGVKAPRNLKTRLVAVGLWVDVPGGWRVHDYLKHNRAAAEIRATKDRRRAGGSLGGRPTKETSDETLEVSGKVNLPANQPENPSHLISATATTTATTTAEAGTRAAPLHVSHKGHAVCGRVCLHGKQFAEFVQRRNHPDAEREIDGWATEVINDWTNGIHAKDEPGETFEFWRDRYAERWPATRPERQSTRQRPSWAPKPAVNS